MTAEGDRRKTRLGVVGSEGLHEDRGINRVCVCVCVCVCALYVYVCVCVLYVYVHVYVHVCS